LLKSLRDLGSLRHTPNPDEPEPKAEAKGISRKAATNSRRS
jgi:hypothetical protein